jgi:RNA polymerase sigma-70 factor, ECF subfamily
MADSLSLDYGRLLETVADRTEMDLVERLRACEEAAFEELIVRFQQPVYNLTFRLVPNSGDCADVVQEVFLKVFRSIGSFRGQSSLKTWIYRIAVNEAHNHRRWFSRHKRQEVMLQAESDDQMGWDATLSDHAPSPFDRALSSEMRVELEVALQQMPAIFRDAVVLRDIEELSYEEIAEILSVNLGTVKSRILRGRGQLGKLLRERWQHSENGPVVGLVAKGGSQR